MDDNAAYHALAARDTRFDGVFYVGVTSTGIYCRPICPARTPLQQNCHFFPSAAMAEKAGFRPCLRCRPELAPGEAPVDQARRIAHLVTSRMNEGALEEGGGIEDIARELGLSSRQLRRIVQQELGVSPVELLQTHRLLLAKQLLTETRLQVIDVAFASGFSSLRRFNSAFRSRYGMPPTRLRREASAPAAGATTTGHASTVRLAYRPPYDWEAMLDFLRGRRVVGVEEVTDDAYSRTVRLGDCAGWIRVTHAPEKHSLLVEFSHSLTPALPALLDRLRHLFDLTARPDLIAAHLAHDERLRPSIAAHPGLRVPGAFDGFELAVRAILGQQITVKAATTLSCRFAEVFGGKINTPISGLTHLSPTPGEVAKATAEDVARLGIVGSRARSILALAEAYRSGQLRLVPGNSPEQILPRLIALPGIGPWTAHYIAMRALRWPDAFLKEDIAVRNRLGGVTPTQAEALSLPWRPWRSYAVLHVWKSL